MMVAVQKVAGAVVVGVDGSEASMRALDWGAEQARLQHVPLAMLHAAGPSTITAVDVDPRTLSAVMHAEGRRVLQAASRRLEPYDVGRVCSDLVFEDPRNALLEASRYAATVVVGARGHGRVATALLGSVARDVVRRARCPVVVGTPPGGPVEAPGRGVLCATDGRQHSERAVAWAFRAAALRGWPLTLVRVVHDDTATATVPPAPAMERVRSQVLADARHLLGEHPALEVSVRLEHGRTPQALARAAAGMDLVVLGAHRRPARRLLDGDVPAALLRRAPCFVAVVPSAR